LISTAESGGLAPKGLLIPCSKLRFSSSITPVTRSFSWMSVRRLMRPDHCVSDPPTPGAREFRRAPASSMAGLR